jgi:opacity protein-like surface antigen
MKIRSLKFSRFALVVLAAGLAVGATPLLAADTGLYFNTDLGANFMSDIKLNNNNGGGKVSMDAGLRWDLALGYAFKVADQVTVGPEIETGLLYNSVKAPSTADLYQVPVLGNLDLNWHLNPKWDMYFGGGAGADSWFVENSGGNVHDNTDFAWDAQGGIRYNLNSHNAIGLGYKYLGFKPNFAATPVGNHAIFASYTLSF